MAKQRTKSSQSRKGPPKDESNVSVASTVFWLLCVMCAIAAEIAAVVTGLVPGRAEIRPVEMIHNVALFLCLVTAALAMIMVPIVLKVRDTPPPKSAIQLTYGVAAVTGLLLFLFR